MHPPRRADGAGGQVLGDGLSRRARDPDDLGVLEAAPCLAGEIAECRQWVADAHDGRLCRVRRRRGQLDGTRDQGDRRTAQERVGHELVPVARRLQRDEARAGREDARVDGERRRDHPAGAGDQLPAGRAGDLGRGQLHLPSRARRPSSSRATTRSSNGSVMPAAVWPVSCPFPAMTTTSPARASSSARRMAARRSSSTAARALRRVEPFARGVRDRNGVLGARVVRGQHHDVGAPAGGLPHERALGGVTIAAAAEDHDHASRPGELARGAEHRVEGGGRVRVVDEDGERLAGVDPLQAPGHRHGCLQTVDDRGERQAAGERGRGRGERVADVESTRVRELDVSTDWGGVDGCAPRATTRSPTTRSLMSREAEAHTVVGTSEPGRDDVGVTGVDTEGHEREVEQARAHRELAAVPVVGVHDGDTDTLGREQRGLGDEVLLHRRVVVEVILGQVREARSRERDAVDAVLRERMRRHLHGHGRDTGVAHPREQCLQLVGLGRRARDGDVRAGDPRAERADQPGPLTRRVRDRLEQVGHRGLAVGARHSEAAHRRATGSRGAGPRSGRGPRGRS